MKLVRMLVALLAVALLSVAFPLGGAAVAADPHTVIETGTEDSAPAGSDPYFGSFGGVVREITERDGAEGLKYAMVENESGEEAYIIIEKDTYVAGEIEVGAKITGYYDQNAPMIMIYPPHYSAEAVVVEPSDGNVKVDVFDDELISSDRMLKLMISDDTEILLQDGTGFEGGLANRKLMVFYNVAEESLPARTTPDRVIVLYDRTGSFVSGMTPEEVEAAVGDVSAMDILVDNRKLEAPAAYISPQGAVMVPLRAAAEALGREVGWVPETGTVLVGKDISLAAGQNFYYDRAAARRLLGSAPELTDARLYVPLDFFREVMGVNNAYVLEGRIVIDNGERLE